MFKHLSPIIISSLIAAQLAAGCATIATPSPTAPPRVLLPPITQPPPTPTVTEEPPPATPEPAVTAVESAVDLRSPEQAALDAVAGQKLGGSVSVLGDWVGTQQDSFLAMVKPFTDATGIQVQYSGTQELATALNKAIDGENPPDLAAMPDPALLASLASQGKLVDLKQVLDLNSIKNQYTQSWVDLGTSHGTLAGMAMNALPKSLIWYNPKAFAAKGYQAPSSWDELSSLTRQIVDTGVTPWCIGLGGGALTGRPGTDWIEDFILNKSGDQAYNDWWHGTIPWTDPKILNAWQAWGQIVSDPKMVNGGINGMLTMNFASADALLFTTPPDCYLVHQGSQQVSSLIQDNPGLVPGEDFDFFLFPPAQAGGTASSIVNVDMLGMLKKTPQSTALYKYLLSPEAQAIWVESGTVLSPNRQVPLDSYPDQLTKKLARILVGLQVATLDASDMMPVAMDKAFLKAVMDYVQSPPDLNRILANLESIRADAYK
jgi:alpha-glucoside transport system substrate-binding protein